MKSFPERRGVLQSEEHCFSFPARRWLSFQSEGRTFGIVFQSGGVLLCFPLLLLLEGVGYVFTSIVFTNKRWLILFVKDGGVRKNLQMS